MLWFSLKNDYLGLRMKISKFLGVQPKKKSSGVRWWPKTYWNSTPFLNLIMTPLIHFKSKHFGSTTHSFSTVLQHELSMQLTAFSFAFTRDQQIEQISKRTSESGSWVDPLPIFMPLLTFTVSKVSFWSLSPRTIEIKTRIFLKIIKKLLKIN